MIDALALVHGTHVDDGVVGQSLKAADASQSAGSVAQACEHDDRREPQSRHVEQSQSRLLVLADQLRFVEEQHELGVLGRLVGDEVACLVAAGFGDPEIGPDGLTERGDRPPCRRRHGNRGPPDLVDQCLFADEVSPADVDEERFIRIALPEVFDQGRFSASRCTLEDPERGGPLVFPVQRVERTLEMPDFVGPASEERRDVPVAKVDELACLVAIESHG